MIIDGQNLHGHAAGPSYQAALDTVVDKVERQVVDHREKPRLRARPEEEKQILRRIADGSAGPRRERRIVKTKRFGIEPMFEEDAIAGMEELGHRFFVFVNAETERVAVLYARDDGDYGLIEPVVAGEYTKGKSISSPTPAQAAGSGSRYTPASRTIRPSSTIARRRVATSGWNSASRWLTSFSGYGRSSVKQRSRR